VVISGVAGTFAASLNFLDSFAGFLFGLSIIFAPIAGIYVIDFFVFRCRLPYDIAELETVQSFSIAALVAWIIGTGIAYLSYQSIIHLTSIEAIDSIMAAMLSYFLLGSLKRRSGTA